jgi:hypothetical protein
MYGYGRGFGFGGVSPHWPYVGVGRGGLPRCWYPGTFAASPYATSTIPYAPGMTREQKLTFLNEEAEMVRRHLEDIEARIRELEPKEK